jgi:KDO2-lipid IV(A) lauroyltransferase
MSLRALLNTRYGVETALTIARGTPRRLGYKITDWGAVFFARRRRTDLVKAVHLNQWVARGLKSTAVELHRATIEVFRSTGRSFYDFYHNMDRPKEVLRLVRFDESFEQHVVPRQGAGEGTLIVTPHLSNFDLAGRMLAMVGFQFQILSFPVTPGGYKLQNQLRSEGGLEVTPMSVESMRQAKQRLLNGGMVLTGMDRPLEESNYPVRFFGHTALLPVAYIRMAMQAKVPVIMVACQRGKDAKYKLYASEPMYMSEEGDDLRASIIANAERVAAQAEYYIRQTPQQWAMFYPVWPQLSQLVPRWGEKPAMQAQSTS